jgi:hypothetical protein
LFPIIFGNGFQAEGEEEEEGAGVECGFDRGQRY